MEQVLRSTGTGMPVMLYGRHKKFCLVNYFKHGESIFLEIIILDDSPFSLYVMTLQLIQIHSILKKVFFQTINERVIFSRSFRLTAEREEKSYNGVK